MKNHLKNFNIWALLLISSMSWGQSINCSITSANNSICFGDSTLLSIQSSGNSCGTISGSLQNGLVGWWPFCGNANDESGNGNNGTVIGATLTTDRFGNSNQAYSFDGVDDYIEIVTNPDFSFLLNNSYSINLWFNLNSINNLCSFIGQGDGDGLYQNRFWRTYINQGQLYNHIRGNLSDPFDTKNQSSYSSINTWTMITMVRNYNNDLKLFIGGVLVDVDTDITGLANPFTNQRNIFVGAFLNAYTSQLMQFMHGKIDDIGIWNRVLTAQEIEALYNQGNLSTWWSDGTTNQSSIQVHPSQTTTYSVIVSDGVGSCTDSITIQVNNPQINAGSDLSVCEGETATLTATGADTYAWDNGVINGQPFTPTVDGYYTVVGTDTLGCSNTVSVFLDVLQPTSSTISPVSCDTYIAPDNEVYTNSGQYTAIIPNTAGCDSTITINLTVNNSTSSNQTVTGMGSYTWHVNGQTYTESGFYTSIIGNSEGCDSTITLNLTISSSSLQENSVDFSIYPNPISNYVTIQTFFDSKQEFRIIDPIGRVLFSGELLPGENIIDLQNYARGTYSIIIAGNSSPIPIIKE